MTLNELEQDVYRRMSKSTSSVDSSTQTRIRAFLNQRMRELLTRPDCSEFREATTTFASVANQELYALPQAIARINRIIDTSNERVLEEWPLHKYREVAPNADNQTGLAEAYAVLGLQRVALQPSNASAVFVDSDAAGDTNTAHIEGIITGGYRRTASQTMTGTTAVQIGSLATWERIENFYLSAAAVGNVTLHEDADGGTELARISVGRTQAAYQSIYLWPTPSSVVTYTVDYTRQIEDLSVSTDVPPFPEDFHRVLVYGACLDECIKTDDPRAQVYEREWLKGVSSLMYWLHARPSYRPGGAERGRSRGIGNNLGAWFPAGRW